MDLLFKFQKIGCFKSPFYSSAIIFQITPAGFVIVITYYVHVRSMYIIKLYIM
jgi:hypothetical protein